MEASGSSSCLATIEETIGLDEDSDPHLRRGQWAIAWMNLPLLALA
jgi:hypothetical protein